MESPKALKKNKKNMCFKPTTDLTVDEFKEKHMETLSSTTLLSHRAMNPLCSARWAQLIDHGSEMGQPSE